MAILRVRQPDGSWAEVPALRGSDGNGIESVTLNDDYTMTIRFTNGTEQTTESLRGEPGKPGEPGEPGSDATVTADNVKAALGYTPANGANYLPLAGGTMNGELVFNGGDQAGKSKIVLATGTGQITNSGTQTLFGFIGATTLAVGHSSYALSMRGNASRPLYNNNNIALQSDLNRSTAVNAADTNYSTLMARGTSLNSAETTPAVNGAIAWTYA